MKEKLIFDIPIYSMTKNDFSKKWDRYKERKKQNYININQALDDYEIWLDKFCFPQSVWQYNQIIGHIQIILNKDDIIFELWLTKDKNFHYNGKKKHFIENMPTIGLHFYAGNMNDNEIKQEINKYLDMIKNDFLNKNYFLDDTIYTNLINNINIKQLM